MLGAAACALGAVAVLLLLPSPGGTQAQPRSREQIRMVLTRRLPKRAQAADHEEAAQLLRQLSALLSSGRGEAQAWADLRDHWARTKPEHAIASIARQIAASHIAGVGTSEALSRLLGSAEGNGEEGRGQTELRRTLRRLLAVARLSETTGAPLAHLIERLAASLDDAAELRASIQSASAGPRLTQLILTLLPVGGVLLGHLMGAQPLQALTSSAAGLGCLALGLLFLGAGRLWSRAMIRAVEARI
ncbi:type II secretion system F family protein [Nesterenkonia sp. NBAIMH1]|uniref:type II secretion system F family protein n=1 Tax=Nesterenkonia sp. NBAIMH1 TaxID=2600320 RepID=UPI0011B39A58|nr:type II secretion system F family protein [Nesterenkonia sp. NBAIMH1]